MSFILDAFSGSDAGSEAGDFQIDFNQQAIDEVRKQLGITQENIAPFLDAGTGALPDVIQGTSAQGLDTRLAEIFNTDIFGSLVEERGRAVQNQLAAGGLTRSGGGLLEAARVPTDIGLALEQLLSGRSTNLAGSGQNAALGLGSLGANSSNIISELLQSSGKAGSSGIITDAQSQAQASQNILNTAIAAGTFFSDPALKMNAEEIGKINDLTVYQWDWVKEVRGSIIQESMGIGFMADEVQEKYPEYVGNYGGFKLIKYTELLSTLENANTDMSGKDKKALNILDNRRMH